MLQVVIRYLFIITVLLGAVVPEFALATQRSDIHFYFVQITDTHFGDRDHYKRMEEIVDAINRLPMKIECVVHTGDITADKLEDEITLKRGLAILQRIQVPIHFVPGNHDILRRRTEKTIKAYMQNLGHLTTQAEYQGVVFIFIYTEPLAKSFSIIGYDPLEQLESALNKTANKPVVVFHHRPSVEDFYENKMHSVWKREFRKKWEKLINSHNVKAVIAGHFHRDEHHWLGNVPLYVSPPVAGYWGRQATFRIYEYRDGRIGYRTQYIH